MGQFALKRSQHARIEGQDAPERIIAFLRAAHPVKTAESVAALTGVSEGTVRKWLGRASVPGGVAMLLLVGAYGPEFLAALMKKPPAWLVAASREAERDRLRAQLEALQARLEA